MDSRDLTRDQIERLERVVLRHRRYYLALYRRAQANDIPFEDTLVQGVCEAWQGLADLSQRLEDLKRQLPQHYRPLAEATKKSGLAERELPWAQRQLRAAREVERHEGRPSPPKP